MESVSNTLTDRQTDRQTDRYLGDGVCVQHSDRTGLDVLIVLHQHREGLEQTHTHGVYSIKYI